MELKMKKSCLASIVGLAVVLGGIVVGAEKKKSAPRVKPAMENPSSTDAAPAPSAASAPIPQGPAGGQGNLGSLEVTGKATDEVLIEKPIPEIKIEARDLVDSMTGKTEKLLERPRPIPAEEDFARFDRLASAQTARPWLPDLAESPLISFQPEPAKTSVKGWRLEVTDERGDVIQTLTGKGNPVNEIVWDGRDKNGEIIRVAAAYSYRFVTVDDFNNAHTTLGKAFTLRHLKYRNKKNVVVEISSKYLFKDAKFSPEALPIFERTLDVLREYSRYPFSLEFYTDAPKGEQVKARQKAITEKATRDLILPPESIKYTYLNIKDRGDVVRFLIRLR